MSGGSRRFTVEGDPSEVLALAEAAGWTIKHQQRWWQRTYSIPRWQVWLVWVWAVLSIPRSIYVLVGWLS